MPKNKSNLMMALVIVGLLVGGYFFFAQPKPAQPTATAGVGKVEVATSVCPNVASINALYNDYNFYKSGTDPASNLTIYAMNGAEFKKTVADDATTTTIPTLASFKAVAGTHAGTPSSGYFSEPLEFSTACADLNIQPKLKPSGSPTITITNDNGVTLNTDTNDESIGASATVQPTVTVKAASENCASRHGAYLIADYVASRYSKLSTSDLADGNTLVLLSHNSATTNITGGDQSITQDQFKVWLYDGELCNGAKIEPMIKVESSSTQPTEDQNIDFYWLSRDIDIDADTYLPLAPAIYDEDNNVIYDVSTNKTYFVS